MFKKYQRALTTARHGRSQKHDTEETVEAEDLGVCVAGDNSPQAAEILVNSSTEGTKEKPAERQIIFWDLCGLKICAG
jgi:hypothetical protein